METLVLESLNPPQLEAVQHDRGPLLVLAGAGSGKTRVVTYRIARLILERGIQPGRILAVTFTNRAAKEMTERIVELVGPSARGLWIGTFHAMCVKILRRHADLLGYPKSFTIYDTDEQRSVIKRIIQELDWDSEEWQPAKIQNRISYAKNHRITPEDLRKQRRRPDDASLAEVFEAYQRALVASGAMDFDDLLLNALKLMEEYAEIRSMYQTQFEYVIVDEYQDTNEPQHELTRILAEPQRNLCVVGDDDQSIYRWRGARFKNILELPKLYRDLRVVRLEQNYRSTTNIVKAAQAVIARNLDRHGKELFTTREPGELVWVVAAENEEDEARQVAQLVKKAIHEGVSPQSIGLLYRTNAQSRILEEVFVREEIPYRIVGGLAFYQRMEIKTLLAYLRLLIQPQDDWAFLRIINVPRRGIGQMTLRQLQAKAGAMKLSLFETAKQASSFPEIAPGGALKLQTFCLLLNRWAAYLEDRSLAATLQAILEETSFEDSLRKEEEAKADVRIENVRELITAMEMAEKGMTTDLVRPWEENSSGPTLSRVQKLEAFLERVTLNAGGEEEEQVQDAVSLMTLHSAKGLEFKWVFLTGLEEGIFPHAQSMASEEELEEERRLCYVGMTRARDRLILSYAFLRRQYGQTAANSRSRFLEEIPPELTHNIGVAPRGETGPFSFERDRQARGTRGRAPSISRSSPSRSTSSPPLDTVSRPARIPVRPPDFLQPGRRVRHRTFGVGRVLKIEGEDPTWRVTVDFHIVGPKTVVQKFARLEPA